MRSKLAAIAKLFPDRLVYLPQNIYANIPIETRYGDLFRKATRFLAQSQFWTKQQHDEFQLQAFRSLLSHAFDNTTFYRDLYTQHKIHPSDIKSLADIRQIPSINKTDLQNRFYDFRAKNFPKKSLQYHTTGGSTGQPVGFYWDLDRTVPLERAFLRRQWRWVGFEMESDRSIVIRGIPVSSNKLAEKISGNQLRLSSYDMTPLNLDTYIKIIEDFDPVAIQAYPSSIYILAQHILKTRMQHFKSLRVILCGSENLYTWQRDAIELAFGCRVYSWYGHSEYLVLGGECEYSKDYHCYTEYGVTELITERGDPANPGEFGEIIATGFNNYAMPLIRYRTQDLGLVSTKTNCRCGRHYPLIQQIEGRLQEMIVSKNGNFISMTSINMHNEIFDNVYQFQFHQETAGEITLKIVQKPSFNKADEERIKQELEKKLKDQVKIQIRHVDSIPLTSRGKARFLIQSLPINGFPTPN